ncbi:hypothetical protein Tco_1221404 [Tanacetum coccineum]
MMRSYEKAILDSNLGSTIKLGVIVNPDDKTYFDRFYVYFAGLADGWMARCMKIIALDGCFLKSPNQGEILNAIGRDKNNHIYLVAWAMVNVENKTWVAAKEGLMKTVKDVMSNAEHKQCGRHIYENFRKQYLGLDFRQLFWAASKASYPQFFNKIMDKIKSTNPNAHKMHLYEMYIILNPNHRNLLHNEINRQTRIEELESELFENSAQLRRCEASLSFWKSTFLAFVICVVLVFAMK